MNPNLENGTTHDSSGAQPPLVSAKELAVVLGCSVQRVRDMTRLGVIPYHVVGKRKKYDISEVLAATRHQAEPPDTPRPLGGRTSHDTDNQHLRIEAMRR